MKNIRFFKRKNNIRHVELIDNKSKWWLFYKGVGSALTIAIAIIIAFMSFRSFNLAHYSTITQQYNEAQKLINEQRDKIDSLKSDLDIHYSNRFIIRIGESHVLFDDIYLVFRPRHPCPELEVRDFDTVILEGAKLNYGSPIKFKVRDQNYFILIENRFANSKNHGTCISDSIMVYWDSF